MCMTDAPRIAQPYRNGRRDGLRSFFDVRDQGRDRGGGTGEVWRDILTMFREEGDAIFLEKTLRIKIA